MKVYGEGIVQTTTLWRPWQHGVVRKSVGVKTVPVRLRPGAPQLTKVELNIGTQCIERAIADATVLNTQTQQYLYVFVGVMTHWNCGYKV